jgi:hypothetical protein
MAVSTPDLSDFYKGDPAKHVLGRSEEKPARIHGRQKPKPPRTGKVILADILYRMEELKPVVAEYKELLEAQKALKGI